MKGPRHVLTVLAVADVERAAAFYGAAFGWETSVDLPVFVQFVVPGGNNIAVYRRDGYALNTGVLPEVVPDGGTSGAELYLYCDDLDAAIAAIEAAGARRVAERALKDWGDEAAYYTDPDGYVIALATEAGQSADSAPD